MASNTIMASVISITRISTCRMSCTLSVEVHVYLQSSHVQQVHDCLRHQHLVVGVVAASCELRCMLFAQLAEVVRCNTCAETELSFVKSNPNHWGQIIWYHTRVV